eukprot:9094992-Pyramimonas_sp.AAC.1
MWDCQRTVRVSLLGSDDSQVLGFRVRGGLRRGCGGGAHEGAAGGKVEDEREEGGGGHSAEDLGEVGLHQPPLLEDEEAKGQDHAPQQPHQ